MRPLEWRGETSSNESHQPWLDAEDARAAIGSIGSQCGLKERDACAYATAWAAAPARKSSLSSRRARQLTAAAKDLAASPSKCWLCPLEPRRFWPWKGSRATDGLLLSLIWRRLRRRQGGIEEGSSP
jgi:hypothetical protein